MDTKLTIMINKQVIKNAKEYAKLKHTSVSTLVENYLKVLTQNQTVKDKKSLTPIVDSLCGIICLPDNYDYKEGYYNKK